MIRLKKGIASRCWENLVLLLQATILFILRVSRYWQCWGNSLWLEMRYAELWCQFALMLVICMYVCEYNRHLWAFNL